MHETEVTDVIKKIRNAWTACSKDYKQFKINGEQCLQAALYYHLRKALPSRYTILTEAYVGLPDKNLKDKSHNRIDILICEGAVGTESPPKIALAGIELKFGPKGEPKQEGIQKDLQSLSDLKNTRPSDKRVKILFKRHGTQLKSSPAELRLHTHAKVLLGIFCKDNGKKLESEKSFWNHYRPTEGRWKDRTQTLPRKLGVLVARASPNNTVDLDFWGAANIGGSEK